MGIMDICHCKEPASAKLGTRVYAVITYLLKTITSELLLFLILNTPVFCVMHVWKCRRDSNTVANDFPNISPSPSYPNWEGSFPWKCLGH